MKHIFKKLRFLIRLCKAFVTKWYLVILLGLVLGVLVFILLPRFKSFLPKSVSVKKVGILGKYTLQNLPDEILSKISLGLTKISNDGQPLPSLSTRWEISKDQKVYTFYFDNKYYWHDGTLFHPNDINYIFKDAQILPIDFQTLKIKLEEPFSPFASIVSRPIFKRGLIGLADYRVSRIEKTGQTLKTIFLDPYLPNKDLTKLKYRFYLDFDNLITGFKLGEINEFESSLLPEEFKNRTDLKINEVQKNNLQVVLFFDTEKDPFMEKNFRQAIAYSLEKEPGQKRSPSPISFTSWAFNPGVKKYEQDLENSRSLLEKIKIDKGKLLNLTTFPDLSNTAEKIKTDIGKLGLKIEIKMVSSVPEDFDMFLAVRQIPDDPDQYLQWHTGQNLNISKFSNPRIDKFLEDGRKTFELEERKKIYQDFQRFLVEESPAVFLYHPTYNKVSR